MGKDFSLLEKVYAPISLTKYKTRSSKTNNPYSKLNKSSIYSRCNIDICILLHNCETKIN